VRSEDRVVAVLKRSDGELHAAMVFLSVLAYPKVTDQTRRERAILAMQTWCARQHRALGGAADVSTVIRALRVEHQDATLRLLGHRLEKRLEAGRVTAMLLLGVSRPGRRVAIPPEQQKATRETLIRAGMQMDDAAKRTATHRQEVGAPLSITAFAQAFGNRARFLSETWRPDLLPMCLAFHFARVRWKHPHGFNVHRLLANPAWAIRALETANYYADALPELDNLPFTLRRSLSRPHFVRIALID
jgi:hypothetical protein